MYKVFRVDGRNDLIEVASRQQLREALQVVEALYSHWPGEYIVRDSDGNEVFHDSSPLEIT